MPLIVSVSSLKGGVGKTSLTLGLASAGMDAGMKILVIDMDPHGDASTGLAVSPEGTDIGTMLASPRKYSLNKEVRPSGWNDLQASKSQQTKAKHSSPSQGKIDVARGSSASTALENLSLHRALPRLKKLISGQIHDYDLVLIDCPPTLGRLTSMAWAVSDRVISVAEPSLFSVAGTERTLRAIARFEANSEYSVDSASIVINKVREGDPEHSYRIEEMRTMFGELVADPVLPDYPGFQRIQGSAYPVHYWPEDSSQEFAQALSDILSGLLGSTSSTEAA